MQVAKYLHEEGKLVHMWPNHLAANVGTSVEVIWEGVKRARMKYVPFMQGLASYTEKVSSCMLRLSVVDLLSYMSWYPGHACTCSILYTLREKY